MFVAVIDPAMGILDIKEVPNLVCVDTGITNEVFDKTSPFIKCRCAGSPDPSNLSSIMVVKLS